MWNYFEINGPRMSNNIEAYNHKLKAWFYSASPNIYKTIRLLTVEENRSCFTAANSYFYFMIILLT